MRYNRSAHRTDLLAQKQVDVKPLITHRFQISDAEDAYALTCEEYDEKQRGHTQLWKYIKTLAMNRLIEAKPSRARGQRGKTTRITLIVPALDLEQELCKLLK